MKQKAGIKMVVNSEMVEEVDVAGGNRSQIDISTLVVRFHRYSVELYGDTGYAGGCGQNQCAVAHEIELIADGDGISLAQGKNVEKTVLFRMA